MQTPRALGYRMPAEWAPHRATWLSWPHNRNSWPGKFEPVPAVWAKLVALLSQGEAVEIMAGEGEVFEEATRLVGHLPRVRIHPVATNDAWMRDHGPTFLVGPPESDAALVDWKYNAWGGKYPHDRDDLVPGWIANFQGRKRFEPGIVLEGGSIDVNGLGTVLTTEQCLLNQNRNPHLTRAEIEQYLADYLNAPHVLWLGEGVDGDDTDGHIDDLTRFVAPRVVVTVVEPDPSLPNHAPLADNLKRLKGMVDQDGRPLEVLTLPMPRPMEHEGQPLPASYANFYIANEIVVVPTFNDPADEEALATLQRVFPSRRVIGVYAVDLVWGLGAFHCITQQEPTL